jgi:acetoin utilization deacetylase AcuC-like enzyme
MRVFHSADYTAAAHAFDTTRKAAWVADEVRDLPGVELTAPWGLDTIEAAIRRVHDGAYVDAIATGTPRALAESQGFAWDPGLWTGVRASTAGVRCAVDVVLGDGDDRLAGSLSSGMHHAKHARGAGFCTVNGLVVAAVHAIEHHDVDVTVLDVDAHAGGGTDQLLRHHGLDRVRHLDLTVDPYDSYVHLTPRPGDVNIEDDTLGDDAYLAAVDRLLDLLPSGPGHLVLHNAGMDPYPAIGFAALEERERRIAAALRERELAAVFVLAGGYTWSATPQDVARAHGWTVREFAAVSGAARTGGGSRGHHPAGAGGREREVGTW